MEFYKMIMTANSMTSFPIILNRYFNVSCYIRLCFSTKNNNNIDELYYNDRCIPLCLHASNNPRVSLNYRSKNLSCFLNGIKLFILSRAFNLVFSRVG